MFGVASILLVVWNYCEPLTYGHEINPVTLSVRRVEYFDRPITGRSALVNAEEAEMDIGVWLRENNYLDNAPEAGYWINVKSYNQKRGFRKGMGVLLRPLFEQSNLLSPMPSINPAGRNQHWIDWCTANPMRAEWAWKKYSQLAANPHHLNHAAGILTEAINYSPEGNDGFEETMERIMHEFQVPK